MPAISNDAVATASLANVTSSIAVTHPTPTQNQFSYPKPSTSTPTSMQTLMEENRLMPKSESWWDDELKEKREILESFWNERITKLNQNSVNEFKRCIINISFPSNAATEEKIDKLFSAAISNKINFDTFFDELKYLPLLVIRGVGLFEKLLPETPQEINASIADIDASDLMNIKRYMVEKGVSASIAIGNSEGKLINPEYSENQSSSFAIHSVGKVFTGMLAMLMIRNGTISEDDLNKPIQLDKAVSDALPPTVREQLKRVTLHQVMTHNAGLGDYLGHYCHDISEGKRPDMKQPEDFLQFCDDSYYLRASTEIPNEKQTRPCGYFLVKNKDDWNLFHINDRNEKNEVKIDDIDGLRDALNALPNKPPSELFANDLEKVHLILNQHYCDSQIDKFRYSNAGILLAGLAIKHAYEKKHGPCSYDEILQKHIIQDANIENFSSARPLNAKFNKDDNEAPHIAGSPAGGYWTTAADLAKFGQWIHQKCSNDPKLIELMKNYGQEFYNKDTRVVSHGGAIPSSSAFLSVSLNTGQVLATLSDQPIMAPELHFMVQNKVFHKQPQAVDGEDLDTSPRAKM
jgi:CubicO group peptidase (beta-lactamase class C family)